MARARRAPLPLSSPPTALVHFTPGTPASILKVLLKRTENLLRRTPSLPSVFPMLVTHSSKHRCPLFMSFRPLFKCHLLSEAISEHLIQHGTRNPCPPQYSPRLSLPEFSPRKCWLILCNLVDILSAVCLLTRMHVSRGQRPLSIFCRFTLVTYFIHSSVYMSVLIVQFIPLTFSTSVSIHLFSTSVSLFLLCR